MTSSRLARYLAVLLAAMIVPTDRVAFGDTLSTALCNAVDDAAPRASFVRDSSGEFGLIFEGHVSDPTCPEEVTRTLRFVHRHGQGTGAAVIAARDYAVALCESRASPASWTYIKCTATDSAVDAFFADRNLKAEFPDLFGAPVSETDWLLLDGGPPKRTGRSRLRETTESGTLRSLEIDGHDVRLVLARLRDREQERRVGVEVVALLREPAVTSARLISVFEGTVLLVDNDGSAIWRRSPNKMAKVALRDPVAVQSEALTLKSESQRAAYESAAYLGCDDNESIAALEALAQVITLSTDREVVLPNPLVLSTCNMLP